MVFGLSENEINFLLENANDLGYFPNIKESLETKNLEEFQTNINIYLTTEDCMEYDTNGQNWYTEKGKYVQSLYDKILDWKYR